MRSATKFLEITKKENEYLVFSLSQCVIFKDISYFQLNETYMHLSFISCFVVIIKSWLTIKNEMVMAGVYRLLYNVCK